MGKGNGTGRITRGGFGCNARSRRKIWRSVTQLLEQEARRGEEATEKWATLAGKRETRRFMVAPEVESGQVTNQGGVLSTKVFQESPGGQDLRTRGRSFERMGVRGVC